jgi:hypothetical protein
MDGSLTTDLREIFRAVKILSPASFSLAGWVCAPGNSAQQLPPDAQRRASLVEQLSWQLYRQCYCRRFKGVLTKMPFVHEPDDDFVARLSDANASREHLHRGWQIVRRLPAGHFIAQKNGHVRILSAAELVARDGPSATPDEGASVSLIWPRESKVMHKGFYYIYGEAVTDQQDEVELLRLYWNVRAAGVLELVRQLTRSFNRFQLPYRLKCLNSPAAYERADAAVLYFNARYFRLASELLADTHRELKEYLEPNTPLFSKTLAAGLGLAEEPGNGESFGQQRCRILAEGIWKACERNPLTEKQFFEAVASQFESEGLSLDSPHLNPGSVDDYELPARETASLR